MAEVVITIAITVLSLIGVIDIYRDAAQGSQGYALSSAERKSSSQLLLLNIATVSVGAGVDETWLVGSAKYTSRLYTEAAAPVFFSFHSPLIWHV
ncbi:hypothetical protein HYDPIDRAFT_27127 [Hydnomerulius pinastri MD-312]|nr:hypothetical protein HYDPIDRAFT_27127 [Hydnomerulius pinastri MD-312]